MPQQLFKSHPAQEELTSKLIDIMPSTELNNFYVNSGSEATDNAIKIARAFTRKSNIIIEWWISWTKLRCFIYYKFSKLNCKKNISPLLLNIYFCSDFTAKTR